jgi:S1-C subfamily serine protease
LGTFFVPFLLEIKFNFMNKIITTSVFGLGCFFCGLAVQYLLPVRSSNTRIECREVPVLSSETDTRDIGAINSKEEEIKAYARKITVKVLSGQNSGSGILIKHQRNTYQVVTNDHVLLFGRQDQSYKIKTPDGKTYPAKLVKIDFQNYDLGVLEFESQDFYEVVSLSVVKFPPIGEKVYAAGFPYETDTSLDDGFTFTTGTVNLISELSFRGGYQIGYSNEIEKGMSGGPLLNQQKQIIGINGRHKYPLWGNPYVFEDGTVASPEKKEEMSQSSWAIPIKTFLQFAPEYRVNNQDKFTRLNQ